MYLGNLHSCMIGNLTANISIKYLTKNILPNNVMSIFIKLISFECTKITRTYTLVSVKTNFQSPNRITSTMETT